MKSDGLHTLALAPLEQAAFLLSALLLYLAGVALGRWLKRRHGVRLGVLYQILCIVLAVYIPVLVVAAEISFGWLDLRRELQALLIVLGTLFFIALINRFFWEFYIEQKRSVAAPRFLRDILAIVLVVIALLFVVGVIYGQTKTIPGLLAGSGIVAIILGFALQDLLGNVFSGIALEIGRPFKPGDWLYLDQRYGQVIDVNWRSVRLKTNDDITLEIPNNQIVRNTIVNLTFPTPFHAMRLLIGVDYSAPPNLVKELFLKATHNAPGVLKNPPPRAFLKEFGDSAIQYEIKFYMESHVHYNAACDAIRTNIWYLLKRAGIRIPFPIRTLHIERPKSDPGPREKAIASLRRQPLFESLGDDRLGRMADSASQERYGRRERMIEQGAEGNSMFILLAGNAEVYVETHSGGQAQVGTLRPGDCFGEMSLLTGEQRSATVVAQEDCEVLEIGKEVMGTILSENPEILHSLGDLLARRKLENEGILSTEAGPAEASERHRDYAAGFLSTITSYFGL